MECHTNTGDLLWLAAKDIVQVMIRDGFVTEVMVIFKSKDTVCRGIDVMSVDILDRVIQENKCALLPIFNIQRPA